MNELVIEPGRSGSRYWSELWQYRELLFFVAWRDILIRYKQTAIGVAWAVLQPLLTTLVFVVVFQRVAKLSSGDVPYPILVLCGVLPWQFISQAILAASGSLIGNASLVSKVYFPRLLIPFGAVVASVVDFGVSAALVAIAMIIYGVVPDARIAALPLFVILAITLALGASFWFSALTVRFRDFRFVVPFLMQIGFFISPVGYRTDMLGGKWKSLLILNPVSGIIDGFRWSLLRGSNGLDPASMTASVIGTLVILTSGVWYFRKAERLLADII